MQERLNTEPVYVISIAAKLAETHPQTLRMYEEKGLVCPFRSANNIRLYSEADIERIRQIQNLTQVMGVNLAGVEVILDLLEKIRTLREELEKRHEQLRQEMEQEFMERLRRVAMNMDPSGGA